MTPERQLEIILAAAKKIKRVSKSEKFTINQQDHSLLRAMQSAAVSMQQIALLLGQSILGK